jgi:hypothetical protein
MATWNVLAQAYCHPHRYTDVDPQALDADRRRAAVVDEVVRWVGDVDVVCLQEVDDELVAALEAAGVWTRAVAHPSRADGVAVAASDPLPTEQGELGDAMAWVGAVLGDGSDASTLVVSCHLRHPGDGPVGSAQASSLTSQLSARRDGARLAIGADANAAAGGPPTDAWVGLGLEVHQPSPTAWISARARTTDVLALPPGGRLTTLAGPTGPIPTLPWPSDHRLLAGAWPRQ